MATILVVDDRPSNRAYLTMLLRPGGHRLLEAGDGAGALEQVRKERPDLVITDILMPTMDGYEFVQHVRSDPNISTTSIIFIPPLTARRRPKHWPIPAVSALCWRNLAGTRKY
jgi:two-component system cell cycle sensor histidine kinase/response regulator CckA